MKLSGICLALGVVPLVNLTCAQVTLGGSGGPSDVRAGTARLAEEDVPHAGVLAVHPIPEEDEEVATNLTIALEALQPGVTGETLCPPSSMSCMQVGHAAPLKELTALPAGVKCSPSHLM